ncbi:MAG: hypothetical protein ABIP08_08090 [Lautropia sp.]
MRCSPVRLRGGLAEACHAAMVAGLEAGAAGAAREALARDIETAASFILSRGILRPAR